ncbi:hypothetical protein MBANPS3_011728 [Mucor bainieri]
MVELTEEEKQFKLPFVSEGSRSFFNAQPVVEWDAETYFQASTTAKKQKKINKILNDYENDLYWISRLEGIPIRIKEYVQELMAAKKPTPALLKANIARRACKKRRLDNPSAIVNYGNMVYLSNSTNHGSINVGGSSAEPSSSSVPPQKDDAAKNQEPPSIWKNWKMYMESNIDAFHPFSLAANDIVRAGEGVSGRPNLDEDLYRDHMQLKTASRYSLPDELKEYIKAFAAAESDTETKRVINTMTLGVIQREDANAEFIRDALAEIEKVYKSKIDYNGNEDAFNQSFIWPYLIYMARSIENVKSEFLTGQPVLQAMTRQLKAVNLYIDDSHVYKSDGLVQLFGEIGREILLLETSGCFKNSDKSKVNFDHHKGVYGLLSMLKGITDDYHFGSLHLFMKVKVFFIHAADEHLHLWSICYQKEDVFDLWREASVHILPDEGDKKLHVPRFMQFLWNTKCLIEESINNIIELKQQHGTNSIEQAFSEDKQESLSDIVNPIILKLTKEEDHHGMSNLGPNYSTVHP